MSYRGEDMDLRLPRGRTTRTNRSSGPLNDIERQSQSNGTRYRVKAHREPGPGDSGRGDPGRDRTAPLWVDDTVLAVCNAAHEVAQALHSPEVLLQHLVHGVTRVPAASHALDVYDIDREALRRDVTALISSTAARMPDNKDVPATSSEFKAALRLAGDVAARRDGEAIAVEDLLEVLMNYDNEHPGVELLLNHVNSGRVTTAPLAPELSDVYRHPPAIEPPFTHAEPLYAGERYDYRPPATTYREPPARLSQSLPERLPPVPVQERIIVREVAATPNIEPALRAMEERLGARLSAVEAQNRAELEGHESERRALSELVQQLHADVTAQRTDTAGLNEAIDSKIERIVTAMPRSTSDNTAPIMARLQGLERMFDNRLVEVSERSGKLDERMKSVESAFGHQTRETADIKDTLSDEITVLSGLLQKNGGGADNTDFEEIFGERLDTIETLLLERPEQADDRFDEELLQHVDAVLTKHHKQIAESMHERERSWTAVNERLNKMEHILTAQGETTTESAADRKRLIEAMNERMGQMETLVLQQNQTSSHSFASVEKLLRETKGPGAEQLVDIKGLLGRVSSAQQTTAEVFDQWRVDLSGDLSLLNSRMDQLEQVSSRPVAMLDNISNELRNLHVVTVEKMKAREPVGLFDSFANWLFGPR